MKSTVKKRDTTQRRAIREVFEQNAGPLSTHQVLEAARVTKPRLGIATVYRNLKMLLDEGWLTVVKTPGEPPRYEKADRPAHHHFFCRGCGNVTPVACRMDTLQTLIPAGFELQAHDMILRGLCRSCAGTQ
jgi:Fur family ferric uptake transcriptional regulator